MEKTPFLANCVYTQNPKQFPCISWEKLSPCLDLTFSLTIQKNKKKKNVVSFLEGSARTCVFLTAIVVVVKKSVCTLSVVVVVVVVVVQR